MFKNLNHFIYKKSYLIVFFLACFISPLLPRENIVGLAENLTVWTEINISRKVGNTKEEIKPKKGEIAKVFVDNKEIKPEGTENRVVIRNMRTGYHKITLWIKTIRQEINFPVFIGEDKKATILTTFYLTDNMDLLKMKTGVDKNEDGVIDSDGEWFIIEKNLLYWHKAGEQNLQVAQNWKKEDILNSKFEPVNTDEYFLTPYSQIDLQFVLDKQWFKKLENLERILVANIEIPLYNVFIYPDGNIFIPAPQVEKIKEKIPYIHFITSEPENKFTLISVLPKEKIIIPDLSLYFQRFPGQGFDEQKNLTTENPPPPGEGDFGYPGMPERPNEQKRKGKDGNNSNKLPLDFYYPVLIKNFTITSDTRDIPANALSLPDYYEGK